MIVATVIAFRIGRPLIRLNFLNERLTASYRYGLVRVRDNAENIAFYRGEPVENAGLWAGSPRHRQHLGDRLPESEVPGLQPGGHPDRRGLPDHPPGAAVLQRADHPRRRPADRQRVQPGADALSFFRLAYDDFAGYRAVLDRLTGLLDADEQARALPTRPRRTGRADSPSAISTYGCPMAGRCSSDLQLELDARRLAAGHRAVRHRQDHPAAQPGRPLALRRRDRRTTRRRGHAVLLAAAVPAAGFVCGPPWPTRPGGRLSDDEAPRVLRRSSSGISSTGSTTSRTGRRRCPRASSSGSRSPGSCCARRALCSSTRPPPPRRGHGARHVRAASARAARCTIVSVGHRSSLERLHTDELTLLGEGRWQTKSLDQGAAPA